MRLEYLGLWQIINLQQSNYLLMLCKLVLIMVVVLNLSNCSYDSTIGVNLCRLTVASYCNTHKVSDWSCGPCINSPIKLSSVKQFYNSTGDDMGIIGISHQLKAILLVFRGTVPWDIKNWIQDINFLKTSFPPCDNGGQVHRGFYKAYLEIQQQIQVYVKDYKNQFGNYQIYITGHSLGGALAVHAAIDLISAGHSIQYLYTYGAPRVGDQKFSVWFESYAKIPHRYRITHRRDPVPHLAPSNFGFNHGPSEIFYKGSVKDGFKTCSDSGTKEDPNCCNQYIADVLVTDHLSYYDIDFAGTIVTCQ